ncbi:hypothetical protein HD806DRAFT_495631 [Xylariaceae sp. AK1471]|nr:hypothetical protein HD806DRAFT_495631 [Xylariaceae sp. AK1471]
MRREVLEDAPFLGDEEKAAGISSEHVPNQYQWPSRSPSPATLFLLIFGLLSNGLWWMKSGSSMASESCIRPQLVHSPATSAISYEKRTLYRSIGPENVFTGEPSKELDEAWRELVKPMAVKISAEELSQLGASSIALKDGSGYIAEMAVFHELHCIKRIRRHLHLDYYYGNMTEDETDRETRHMHHCLEYWREAAMCRGDPTLTTFEWNEGRPFSRVYSTHECVNWAKIRAWAESRMVDPSDLGIFSHNMGEKI